MCGIVGIVRLDGQAVDRGLLEAMNARILHRGPDEDGVWLGDNAGLAMRRLSILDLAHGRQPFTTETGDVLTVYNGEIYNHAELRDDLVGKGHTLHTSCDTEVIPHLYEEFGSDLVRHVVGMFAIAVWDRTRRSLLLVRDRLGIKPLYYAQYGDCFVFASELKAFGPCGILGELSPESIYHYFTYGYVPAPWTIFRGVYKLPAGHRLELVDGKIKIDRYWRIEFLPGQPRSEMDWIEELDYRLRVSVKSELISDVALGAFLSGGVDSSTVVALMANVSNAPVRTYSIGFDEKLHDECHYAERIARHFGTEHTRLIVRPEATRHIEMMIRQFDEPFADSSAIPTFCLCELTRRHVKVALSGDGGDELFAGYDRYRAFFRKRSLYRIPALFRRATAGSLSAMLPAGTRGKRFLRSLTLEPLEDYVWGDDELWHNDLLTHDFLRLLTNHDPAAPARPSFAALVPNELDSICLHDIELYLPDDILTKVDRMSMAVSLEVRVPLLDHRVAEFAATLPRDMRLRGAVGKYALKRVLERYVPRDWVHRRKQGFSVPLAAWFRGELRTLLADVLSEHGLRRTGVFRPAAVQFLLDQHLSGQRDQSALLWRILVFQLWDSWRGSDAGAVSRINGATV